MGERAGTPFPAGDPREPLPQPAAGVRAGAPFPAEDPREPLRQLQLAGGCEYVSVVARDALACAACSAVEDRGYAAWDLPPLPLATCTRPGGCRCRYEPLITVVE